MPKRVRYYRGWSNPEEGKITMLFTEWLKAQRHRQDPIGDLAREVAEDVRAGCLPGDPAGWPVVVAHLMTEHELPEAARDALDDAVREYVAGLDAARRIAELMTPASHLVAMRSRTEDVLHALTMAASVGRP